ncbi:MAG: CsbD family protein [Candidatus Binataceae bacterium]
MNEDQVKGKMHQLKGEIKRKWGRLTDDDLTETQGNMEKLMGRIRERSGDRQEEVEKWFRSQGLIQSSSSNPDA